MSEEKAIEILKNFINDSNILTMKVDAKTIETILNLIEKQQKEIEKYKQQIDLEFVEKNFIEKNKVVSKDKIREKIRYLEDLKMNYYGNRKYRDVLELCNHEIQTLKELLKE